MAELTKEEARKLQKGDFIPGGKSIDVHGLQFRRTMKYDVFQCCAQTGHDPQSGPMYCGEVAEIVADVIEDGQIVGYVALCNSRHKLPREMADSIK